MPPGVFVIWDGMGVVARRVEHVVRSDPPTVAIKSANPEYRTYKREADEVNIIGRVHVLVNNVGIRGPPGNAVEYRLTIGPWGPVAKPTHFGYPATPANPPWPGERLCMAPRTGGPGRAWNDQSEMSRCQVRVWFSSGRRPAPDCRPGGVGPAGGARPPDVQSAGMRPAA